MIKKGKGVSKGWAGNSQVRTCSKSSEMTLGIINVGFWEL